MMVTSTSFIMRVTYSRGHWHFILQNLQTGEQVRFSTWEALQQYLLSLPASPAKKAATQD